jgi:hypothetical protein
MHRPPGHPCAERICLACAAMHCLFSLIRVANRRRGRDPLPSPGFVSPFGTGAARRSLEAITDATQNDIRIMAIARDHAIPRHARRPVVRDAIRSRNRHERGQNAVALEVRRFAVKQRSNSSARSCVQKTFSLASVQTWTEPRPMSKPISESVRSNRKRFSLNSPMCQRFFQRCRVPCIAITEAPQSLEFCHAL